MKTVEIRVRPVTRWNITRHESDPAHGASSCGSQGEFSNARDADKIAMALQAAEPGAIVVTSDGETRRSFLTPDRFNAGDKVIRRDSVSHSLDGEAKHWAAEEAEIYCKYLYKDAPYVMYDVVYPSGRRMEHVGSQELSEA